MSTLVEIALSLVTQQGGMVEVCMQIRIGMSILVAVALLVLIQVEMGGVSMLTTTM